MKTRNVKDIVHILAVIMWLCLQYADSGPILSNGLSQFRASCGTCGPGYKHKRLEKCVGEICERCKVGTFSHTTDSSRTCQDCSYPVGCPITQTMLSECTPEHDDVCGCKEDERMDITGLCRPKKSDAEELIADCGTCEPGYKHTHLRSCVGEFCVRCQAGTFSHTTDSSRTCQDCSYPVGCPITQTMLSECTLEHDDVCGCKADEIIGTTGLCRQRKTDAEVAPIDGSVMPVTTGTTMEVTLSNTTNDIEYTEPYMFDGKSYTHWIIPVITVVLLLVVVPVIVVVAKRQLKKKTNVPSPPFQNLVLTPNEHNGIA